MAKVRGRRFFSAVGGAVVLLLGAAPAAAQTGELRGRVLDPQGGAVGGAAVEVVLRNSEDPSDPGYLRSSSFGKPVTTAGGVFGSGGPRAVQLGLRLEF